MIQANETTREESRLAFWMAGCAVAGVLGCAWFGSLRLASGFALGAALSILNYHWMHGAIGTLFSQQVTRVPKSVVAKFALRYPLALGVLYLFYRTGWLPVAGIFAGLFVPVGGVFVEAAVQINEGWRVPSPRETKGI